MAANPELSLCLVVKNEERHLRACLESARDLAAEIIVIDTGSNDATLRIAANFGATVVPFDFTTVDFAAARNHAIAQAAGRWILMLDADETIHPSAAPQIAQLISVNRNDGYFLERHNHSAGYASRIDHVVRLFANLPGYRYHGRVHEIIDASILAVGGRLHQTTIRLDHNFASDPAERRRKNHWYIRILLEEIAADPADDTRLDFLAAEYHQLEMYNEATEIAEHLARIRPLDARAHLFAGTYHLLYKPDRKQARADFGEALRLRPGYPEAESFLQLMDQQDSTASSGST